MSSAGLASRQRQSLDAWTARFTGVLRSRAGISPGVHNLGPAIIATEDESNLLWWTSRLDTADTVWIGASQSGWNKLTEAAGDTARDAWVGLVSQSWTSTGSVAGQKPTGVAFETVQISFPQAAPVKLLVGLSAPPDAVDAQPGSMFDSLLDIELPVILRFGQKQMLLQEITRLTNGSVVDFNRASDEPIELVVNGCVVARGTVVMVNGNYGVRISESENGSGVLAAASETQQQKDPGKSKWVM